MLFLVLYTLLFLYWVYIQFGGKYLSYRYGNIVLCTLDPKICFDIHYLNGVGYAVSTGWYKVPKEHIWYRRLSNWSKLEEDF